MNVIEVMKETGLSMDRMRQFCKKNKIKWESVTVCIDGKCTTEYKTDIPDEEYKKLLILKRTFKTM